MKRQASYRLGKKLLSSTALTAAGLMAFMNLAHAENAWTNFDSVSGSISIDASIPNLTNINQHTGIYVGNSPNLNIGSGQTVNIGQNDTGSLFVARAVNEGSDPTKILGTLNTRLKDSNGNFTGQTGGNVMVLDRNGVVFGANSRIDVGGIIASTGDVTNADLTDGDGKFEFKNFGNGQIINQGTMTIADAGVAAFVSPFVANSGVINAKLGKVAFAAGSKVTLDLYGDKLIEIAVNDRVADALLENSGTVNAEGGQVIMTAQAAKEAVDNVINMSGVVNAGSASVKGGKIILSGGSQGKVSVSGKVNASGVEGGKVDIKGQNIELTSTSEITADGNQAGDIIAFADDALTVFGRMTAQGQSGTGFIETSGLDVSFGDTAFIAATKEWLVDPLNITIGAVLEALIETQLAFFGDSTITTPAIGFQAGNIELNRTINWSTARTFKLVAINDININSGAGISATGLGNFIAEAGDDFVMKAGNTGISLNGGDVTIDANDEFINLAGTINVNGGDIQINNLGGFQALANSLLTSGTGTVTINQNKDSSGSLASNTIQNAIDAISNSGTGTNTIKVGAGTWAESLLLDYALDLTGAGSTTTLVDPVSGDGLRITGNIGADKKVNVSGFTFSGATESGIDVDSATVLGELKIINAAFNNNGTNGVSVGGDGNQTHLGHLNIQDSTFLNNGSPGSSAGDGDILAFRHNGDVTIKNVTVENNNLGGTKADYGIQIRGHNPGTLASGEIVLDNVSVAGAYRAGQIGIQEFSALDLTMTDVELGGQTTALTDSSGWASLYLSNIGTQILNIGNTVFKGGVLDYIWNFSSSAVNAKNATFEGVTGLTATLDQNFAIEDKVIHAMDNALISGLVTWKDNNLFVTQKSGSIQRGVNNSAVGGNVWVDNGTFAESVNVNKSVSLFGNNFGKAGNSLTRNAETIVTPNSPGFLVTANNVTIDGFYVTGGDHGIEVQGGDKAKIINNVVTASGQNGIHLNGSELSRVDDNYIFNITGNGTTSFGNDGIYLYQSHGTQAWRNVIDNTNDNGIQVERSRNVVLRSNVISNTKEEGIDVRLSDNIGLFLNKITNAGLTVLRSGIRVDQSSNGSEIGYNIIENTGLDGITITNSNGVDTYHNNIKNAKRDGISITNAPSAIVRSNILDNNKRHGIHLSTDSDNSTIKDNDITKSGTHGIFVENSNYVLIGGTPRSTQANVIDGAGSDGIRVIGGESTRIISNRVLNTKGDGIEVSKAESAFIQNNDIRFAGEHGINVNDIDGVDIRNNRVRRTGYDGIQLNDFDSAWLTDNLVSDTGDDGIDVSEGGFVSIYDNILRRIGFNERGDNADRSGADGIHVSNIYGDRIPPVSPTEGIEKSQRGFAIEIIGNEIDRTYDDGIDVKNSHSVWIEKNDIQGSGYANDRYLGGGDYSGADGIYVSNVSKNNGKRLLVAAGSPESGYEWPSVPGTYSPQGNPEDYSVVITDNIINETADDGIEVIGSGMRRADPSLAMIEYSDPEMNGGTGRTLISRNDIQNVGYGLLGDGDGGQSYGANAPDGYGADAIHVRDVVQPILMGDGDGDGYESPMPSASIEETPDSYIVEILDNYIWTTGDDGIEVINSGNTLIAGNEISNVGLNTDKYSGKYIGKGSFQNNGDGIHVSRTFEIFDNNGIVDIIENIISSSGDDGIEVIGGQNVLIDGNTITNSGDDGIRVTGFASFEPSIPEEEIPVDPETELLSSSMIYIPAMSYYNAVISNNSVTDSGSEGIHVNGYDDLTVTDNSVFNSRNNGLYVSGFNNGDVRLSGNVFSGNRIGVHFESGVIDLTQGINQFIGGSIGIRFSPFDFDDVLDMPIEASIPKGKYEGSFAFAYAAPILTGFAPLSLVDNTLGTQVFLGQEDFFVELDNEAFFAPGNPTLLNGLNSTYLTPSGIVTPSSTGGVVSPSVLSFLESRFFHFNDRGDLGLFFFGTPGTETTNILDQSDIFNSFDPALFGGSGLNITLRGLPRIPGAPAGGGTGGGAASFNNIAPAGGTTPDDLNNISPAAGNEGNQSPSDLNNINTAAGNEDASCWGDAAAAASGGGSVNLNMGGTPGQILSGASSCGSDI
ncbi:MAG: right-handed parallel beta-helix repeat-containing protein [Alphaproteobacteria bacterium]|nr:right-handed parallel beta-helix repeat-containing protein [Alphaproteobacteria bacterium]